MGGMRAKFINEFERGLDPKKALSIGRVGKIQKWFRDLDIPDENYEITPTGVIFKGSLELSNITWLPDNLEVGGFLNLMDNPIGELPEGLKVSSALYLCKTLITKLPYDIKIGGSLDLSHTKISELPDNLNVGYSLILEDTPIKQLPKGLNIGNDLWIRDTKITKLPDDIEIAGRIWVDYDQEELIAFIKNSIFSDNLRIVK